MPATDSPALRSLGAVYATSWPAAVRDLLIAPARYGVHSLEKLQPLVAALLPPELAGALLPFAVVDEGSLACAVLEPAGGDGPALHEGAVVRLFLTEVEPRHQLTLIDVDPLLYVASLAEELQARPAGLERVLDEIGPAYEDAYIHQAKRPRDFVVRPVRLACQNVIVALAAVAQDSTFDGLSVPAWQTCEVPHVATHEANRALAALTLCDAFSRGGTMEIRFDRPAKVKLPDRLVRYDGHPELRVPASLRRYGRTVGVDLGGDDPASISPAEARELFAAVTPMPDQLRARVRDATSRRGVSPERACYSLLSQVWREIELDLLLATCEHAASVLSGGADWTSRSQRQAESDSCRAALMAGMYFRRLNGRDAAASTDGVRPVEDVTLGASWTVDPSAGSVTYHLAEPAPPPWAADGLLSPTRQLAVLPRVHVTERDRQLVRASTAAGTPAALLVPRDMQLDDLDGTPLLRCPDRLADLDSAIEEKLLTSRISRA